MPAKRKNTRKPTSSKKQTIPGLNLVLKQLDKFDQRFDSLDRRIDAVDQKIDAVRQETAAEFKASRQEAAAEFKAVRKEMTQGFDSLRQEFKSDMAKGFDLFRQEIKTDMQKQFEKHGADIHQHISRVETELKAEIAEVRHNQRYLTTGMDAAAKNYENFTHDKAIMNAEIKDLQRHVEELKKRDMEKAAAIEKIEKPIKAA